MGLGGSQGIYYTKETENPSPAVFLIAVSTPRLMDLSGENVRGATNASQQEGKTSASTKKCKQPRGHTRNDIPINISNQNTHSICGLPLIRSKGFLFLEKLFSNGIPGIGVIASLEDHPTASERFVKDGFPQPFIALKKKRLRGQQLTMVLNHLRSTG